MSTESVADAARQTLRVEPADHVPADARVRHYDELSEPAKDAFPGIVAAGETPLDPTVAGEFTDGEFVKFTDYYRVRVA
ncbi:hypothetical protein ACFQH6_16610 [Halobacteriaceae archaeon GCM10025711]